MIERTESNSTPKRGRRSLAVTGSQFENERKRDFMCCHRIGWSTKCFFMILLSTKLDEIKIKFRKMNMPNFAKFCETLFVYFAKFRRIISFENDIS